MNTFRNKIVTLAVVASATILIACGDNTREAETYGPQGFIDPRDNTGPGNVQMQLAEYRTIGTPSQNCSASAPTFSAALEGRNELVFRVEGADGVMTMWFSTAPDDFMYLNAHIWVCHPEVGTDPTCDAAPVNNVTVLPNNVQEYRYFVSEDGGYIYGQAIRVCPNQVIEATNALYLRVEQEIGLRR